MKVFVYWNLAKKRWSVKALEGPFKGLVVFRTDSLLLTDCTFRVSEAGRQRVLRQQRKNVHAGVVGHFKHHVDPAEIPKDPLLVTYNPYRDGHFSVMQPLGSVKGEVVHADVVRANGRVMWAEGATWR